MAESASDSYTRTWPKGWNPFVAAPLSTLGRVKVAAMLPVVLVRAVLGFSTLLLACGSLVVLTQGIKPGQPFTPLRRKIIRFVCSFSARLLLIILGYWHIPVKRQGNAAEKRKAAVVIANHSSYVEILYVIAHYDVTFASKIENASLPVIGSAIKALQCILIDRQNGKAQAADAVRARTSPEVAHLYPTLCLFPEGTTTTGKCIIRFKRGAFLSGRPVLPLIFKHSHNPDHGFDTSYSCRPSLLVHLMCMWGQLHNRLEVTEMPLYVPSEAEKADPGLFADNVRAAMAREAGLPMYELQWEDKLQYDPKHLKKLAREKAKTAGAALAAQEGKNQEREVGAGKPSSGSNNSQTKGSKGRKGE